MTILPGTGRGSSGSNAPRAFEDRPGDDPARNSSEAGGGGGSPHSEPPADSPLHQPAAGPPPRAGEEKFEPEAIEAARKTFAGPVAFLKSAPALHFLPDPTVPEVAFAGRSNVGKSSLLNALTGRNGLARTSNTPGRTQELNFFDVGDPVKFRLVDMPGYGFAKAPKDVVRKWRFLVNDFLRGRHVLKRVLVLIDSRHGIKEVDREILDMLDAAAVSYRVVLTKGDKIKPAELAEVTERTIAEARKRPAAHPDILATSSEKSDGIAELRAAVLEAVNV